MTKKALFLDRDGVINVDHGYVGTPEKFEFVEGIFSLCRRFKAAGYLLIVVTNQSGIARGLFSESDFSDLSRWMQRQMAQHGVALDAIYHCPHHPDFTGPCGCRKPAPGMLLLAQEAFGISMEDSVMVGDSERDIEAAIAAGVGRHCRLDPQMRTSAATQRVQHLDEIDV